MAVTLRDYERNTPGNFTENKGLLLCKQTNKAGTLRTYWRYRFTFAGKQHEMTLVASGSLPRDRKMLNKWQTWLLDGKNPKIERDKEKHAEQSIYGNTFADAMAEFLPKKVQRITGEKNKKRLESLLTTYAMPAIGSIPLSQIDEEQIVKLLKPIWLTKYPTAKKVLSAINQLMAYKGHVLNLSKIRFDLPPVRHQEVHLAKLKTEDLPGLAKRLWSNGERLDLFLLATILTGSRTLPVRLMQHREIDYDAALWRCPKVKSGEPFDFPLSKQALDVLKRAQGLSESDTWVFPQNYNSNKPLDENSGRLHFQKASNSKATIHGCRAILHDWADPRGFDHLLIELTLQHQALSKVEKAYQRSQYLERRRQLLAEWGDFCWSQIV